ncbi:hypothetical protein [Leifsonia shinshuensis]|uniref:Uncharacterized protein n=1 Tax=Leifsonia shinshuensis TaxID=150026 RepID=A0A7G6Y8U5_9MICO|nr:hypothetical protein [Leifsonia shinshuensis]QNE34910.1 hypothetical protein F1C12_07055 [Leifsonia shinshuensis]
MGIDAAALLAGPRGCRVCMNVAVPWPTGAASRPDPLLNAIFLAAHEREGGTLVVFSAADGPTGAGSDRPPGPPAAPALDEIARMFAARPAPAPDARGLLGALGRSVGAARYWQEPDGADQLAAEPELADLLRAGADAVSRADGAQWWATNLHIGDQWTVEFDDQPRDARPAREDPPGRDTPAAELLARWREAFDREEEARRGDDGRGMPPERCGGSWWSIPPHGLPRTTRGLADAGAVGLHLVEDGLGWRYARLTRATVRTGARVFEIDGAERWAELCARFPLDASASRRGDWLRATGRDGRWLIPDWPRVAEEYDGVHLTVLGYLSTAGRAVPVADDWATVLAGWDPDATYWLTEDAVRPTDEWSDWWADDGREWRRR